MSIASQISRIKGNVSASYEQAEAKGATMPDTLNSDNLAECIASIPTSPTPPPPTGDIKVIIYTYDSTAAKYVDNVYTKADKGDTISLPAIADVAEANIGTADYNPALTADGWSGDVEVVDGAFTIPMDYYEDEICFMAHYYSNELCIVYCDRSHTSEFKSGADAFIVSIFQPLVPVNIDITTYVLLSNLVGPNKEFINSLVGNTRLEVVNCNQNIGLGGLSTFFINSYRLKKVIGMSHLLNGYSAKMTRTMQSSSAIRSINFYGCHASLTDMNLSFQNCQSLNTLKLPHITTERCTIFQNTFACGTLTYLDISKLSTASITKQTNIDTIFTGASLLLYIKMAEDNEYTHLFDFTKDLTMNFSGNTHLGINTDGNDNHWKDHLLRCAPQQTENKNIKFHSNTLSLFDQSEITELQNRGYTITA